MDVMFEIAVILKKILLEFISLNSSVKGSVKINIQILRKEIYYYEGFLPWFMFI